AEVGQREALAVSATPPDAAAAADLTPPRPDGEIPKSSGPVIREREGDMPVTIVVDKPKAKADRRPYYVLGGLVVILAVFLLNRRSRQRVEEKSEEKSEEKPEEKA
ncbi:MAG: hypothetical protein K8M05_16390, partial [Deltaproteobacteria bacterium]|nr:hypothetical protein [Kofleriaceae bacterium]